MSFFIKGQKIDTTCLDIETPIKIECETQFLAGQIYVSLEPKHLISQQKHCPEETIESELNKFCRNVNKTDYCKFEMLDFISGYKDCYVTSKNITVTYQCRGKCFSVRKHRVCLRTCLEININVFR